MVRGCGGAQGVGNDNRLDLGDGSRRRVVDNVESEWDSRRNMVNSSGESGSDSTEDSRFESRKRSRRASEIESGQKQFAWKGRRK